MQWTPTQTPQPAHLPQFVRIARDISADITRGRLQAGARLPGSRTLAKSLGVHRNTVLAAYRELEDQGWTEARPGSGTFVRPVPPEADAVCPPSAAGFDWTPVPTPPLRPPVPRGALLLAGGRPDLSLVPTDEIARAWRRGIRLSGRSLLDYGDPRGLPKLRNALGQMLASQRAVAPGPGGLLVTRGSQMALYLVAQALIRPGDRVVVEALGYPPAWQALRRAGAELVPIPVDDGGLQIDALQTALDAGPIRAVYTTPHHQFPTMVSLEASRRLALLKLATEHRFAILEDDYDNEYHFRGRPVLPLASLDRSGVVVYLGTLSKVLAPGLRLGFVVAPPRLIDTLVSLRISIDRQGDQATEYAVAELIEDGTLARHLRRSRRVYAHRQTVMVDALRRTLGHALDFQVPPGGLALWARSTCVSATSWAEAGAARGVIFDPGERYGARSDDWVRIGFAGLDEANLEEAVARMAVAWGDV